jgi:hypothetical protein
VRSKRQTHSRGRKERVKTLKREKNNRFPGSLWLQGEKQGGVKRSS